MLNTFPRRVTALLFALVCSLGLLAPAQPAAAAPVAWPEGGAVTVASGLNLPWAMVQLEDGSLLVTSSDSGEIIHVSGVGERRVVGTVPDIQPLNEGGLLGLVRDPADPAVFYAYASSIGPAGNDNRIWRLTWDGTRVTPGRVILDRIPHGRLHSGGQLKFGPDGFLYVTTGDTTDPATAQNLGTMAGKILRIDRTGAAAPGNPFAGRPGAEARIWSYGHRNVQGIGWDSSGRLWASEFGANAWDELNRIEPGRNYGWPICEGWFKAGSAQACADPALTNPVQQWRPADASPSSLTVVGDTILIAALRGRSVWAVPVNGGAPVRHLRGDYGRIRSILPSADGRLFVMTSNGSNSDRIVLVPGGSMVAGQHPIDWLYAQIGAGSLGVRDGGLACGLRDGGCFSLYRNGSIYWSPTTGAHAVRGAQRDVWAAQGWENGPLGYPTTELECGLRGGGCVQTFAGGSLYSSSAGTHPVLGEIGARWSSLGAERGFLGYPTGDHFCGLRDGGCFQTFQNGSIYWSPGTGARFARGAIRDKWGREGWELGFLGFPTSDEFCGLRDGGCAQRFQGGAIHWSPASGAAFTRGLIRAEWGSLGWETGVLGYPLSDELCGLSGGGCYQRFQGGVMYWSPTSGAHFTRGAIRERWGETGWEHGTLGYPTGNEFCGLRDSGCFQTFENGSMYWSLASGAHPVRGALRDMWGRSGWENGRWGYPTGAEACAPRHCWQSFQGGVMHLLW